MKDEELLETLATALAPAQVEPSEDEIAALHRTVRRSFGDGRRRPWWRRPTTSMLIAAALAIGGGAAAAALCVRMPSAEPTAALPEAAPAAPSGLAETRTAMDRVRAAIASKDRGDAARLAVELRGRLDGLGAGDRSAVEAEARALLAQAEALAAEPSPVEEPVRPAPPRSKVHQVATGPNGDHEAEDDDEQAPSAPKVCDHDSDDDDATDDDATDSAREAVERAREAIERAREATQRAAERAQRDAERAQRDAGRKQRDVERAQHQAELARERAQQQAERIRERAEEQVERLRERAEEQAERLRERAEEAARRIERDQSCPRDADDDDDAVEIVVPMPRIAPRIIVVPAPQGKPPVIQPPTTEDE